MTLKIVQDAIELGIVTRDAGPMLKFYRDTLGLELEREWEMPGGGHMTRLKCGPNIIKLVVNAQAPKADAPPGGLGGATGYRYWTVMISNLEEAAAACAKAGYHIAVPITLIAPNLRIAMIEDPDGNWVELVQMG